MIIGNEAKSFGIEQTYILFTYPGNLPLPPPPPSSRPNLHFAPCDLTTKNVVRGKGGGREGEESSGTENASVKSAREKKSLRLRYKNTYV